MTPNITPKEAGLLKEFREKLGDYYTNELNEEQRKEYNLVRWLRARDYNLVKAEEMLRKNMEWRKKNDMDNILAWRPPIDMAKILPSQISGKDKEGCYVFILPAGKWDLRDICESGHKETLKKGSMQFFELIAEYIRKSTEEKGEPVTQVVMLQDMEGYSMRQLLSSDVRESNMECMRMLEANYPEILKTAIVVNAPKVFSMLFSMLKPLLSARTLSKVEIYDSNRDKWRSAVAQHFNPDELPSYYGGSNTSCPNYKLGDTGLSPRGPYYSQDLFEKFTVQAGQTYEVEVDVLAKGTVLTWNFRTDDYDVGFHLLFAGKRLFENNRCDSHLSVQKGIYNCEETGKYTLLFDNSFSKYRSKVVYYYVNKKEPEASG